jgi:hypothetical protein
MVIRTGSPCWYVSFKTEMMVGPGVGVGSIMGLTVAASVVTVFGDAGEDSGAVAGSIVNTCDLAVMLATSEWICSSSKA